MNVIRVNNLGKSYKIKSIRPARYQTLQEQLGMVAKSTLGWFHKKEKNIQKNQDFWALRDVSFEVSSGQRIGIIGRNGSGKSTLLKLLSRITAPSEGRFEVRGRVGSLLEVGTGFHPELSGRENIFLNGAILGMTHQEITRRFDAIVAFAGVEKFLENPVKRYSSGMQVRLAFAVAAHLEPDILIIDEVLAVGDAEFQKKCFGKIEDATRSGRTVLFVSHNLGAVRELCETAMVLEEGRCLGVLPVNDAISLYLSRHQKKEDNIFGNGPLRVHNLRLNDAPGTSEPNVFPTEPMRFSFSYQCDEAGADLLFVISIRSLSTESCLLFTHNNLEGVSHSSKKNGKVNMSFELLPLAPGRYSFELEGYLDRAMVISNTRAFEFFVQPVPSFAGKTLHTSYPALLMARSQWGFEDL